MSLSSRCQFWNQVPTACGLKGGKGTFHLDSEHKTGDPRPDCDGVNEECKTNCRDKLNAMLQQVDTVWTQSVSPPDGNINQCDSVSYEVCGEFVQSFDKLYNATEEINPMLTDPNQPWWHAKLLVEYEFDTDEHGIKRLSGGYVDADLYDYGKGQEFPGKVSVIFVL